MAIELGDYLLVPWHEYEILRDPEDLRALLERACTTDHRDHEIDRCIDGLGHGHIVAVRRGRSRFHAFAPRIDPAIPLRELPPLPPAPRPQPTPDTPTPPPAALELIVVTSDGQPVGDTALRISLPDRGFERTTRTDANGRVALVVPEDGTYSVTFDPSPPTLPPAPAEPTTPPEPSALPRDCTHFTADTSAPKRVVLRRPMVTEVVIDGYAEAAKVMRWGGMRPRVDGTVATTRGALRLALWHGRGRTLCVAGHTDALGQEPDNDALALERARSVQLYASGDLDGWAEHCAMHANELDRACALVACNRIMGLAAITLEQQDALELARRQLRARAGLGDHATPADEWRAVADLYDVDLAAFLRTDLAGLAEIRATLSWVESPARGLGERHPRTQAETADAAGAPALAQRRCALLVFGRDDGAHSAAARELCEVYDGTYRRTVLPIPGEVLVQIAVGDGRRDPIALARAWIDVGALGLAEHHADVDGTVRFMTFAGDRIRVAAAFDASGRGTMTSAGLDSAPA